MNNITDVLPLLAEPKKIWITTHHKPDGDALGSTLGLYHYLKQKGHDPVVVSPSEVPDFLVWLPGIDTVLNFESEPKLCLKRLQEADLIFCLDFSRLDRIKAMEQPLRQATQPRVLIDHHLNPDYEAFQYGMSEPEKSSTCEMVYDFIRLAGDEALISNEVSQCLYTGVMTDTGSFRFPITTAAVHEMLADLKRRGLDHAVIHQHIYDSWSAERMRFLGFVLYQRMEIYPQQHVGIVTLSQEDQQRFRIATGDTEGMVNYPLSIEAVTMAVMLTEKKDEIRMSFRSKGNIDVSTFAAQHFNGGGHFNAAGGRSQLSLEETVKKLKTLLKILPAESKEVPANR
ncbi:DHH family phosphoesterase [Taibaiella koreensis]|uniref:DHH family phosphoesterase n=1 Tax=Taibaiella koreensis TaxID=1268548 RepID=UPI000E59A8DC|nr:bifunctional oligoribonuclease/PAP phosphatase NrnA [Taibaiella koreensis]